MTTENTTIVLPQDWTLHYEHSSGPVTGRFLHSLAEGRIEGTRCGSCSMVWLPPRGYCERCFIPIDEFVEVGPEGTLESFTIVCYQILNMPEPPYAIAYCRLDGADTALVNFLRLPIDPDAVTQVAEQLRIGETRLVARFKEERAGRISDFVYELA